MACYHPSAVTVERKSLVDPPREDVVVVPCGKCLGCRKAHARQWAIRLVHEAQLHPTSAWFVTLTYDDGSLPDNGSLDPRDLQLFLKKLRRKHRRKLRYYACGEYGDASDRPHYHLVLYGPELLDRDRLPIVTGKQL